MTDFALTNPENPDLCDFSKSQWYTPPELATRIVQWALKPYDSHDLLMVLEPSCGRGALIHAMLDTTQIGFVLGVDADESNVEHCRKRFEAFGLVGIDDCDFLKYTPHHSFHLGIMNPPFEDGATEQHVLHALKFAPRVVCHCPLTTLAGKDRREGLWSAAYLKRLVIHAARPKYSGSLKGGMTDMCTIDVVRRYEPKPAHVRATGVDVEWW